MMLRLWLLAGLAAAQQMPRQPASKMIGSHNGGLVTNFSSQRLKEDQTPDADNVFFDQDLGVVKRRGQSLYGTISGCTSQVRAGGTLQTTGGSTYFFAICNQSLYVSSGDGSFSVLGSTLSATASVRMVPTLGLMWIVDGVDYLTSTNGVTVSSYTSAPVSNLVDTYYSRLVLADVSGGRSTIWLSGQSSGSDYTIPSVIVATSPAQYFLNGPNDGRNVTCTFGGFKNVLILWNRDEMYGLYGIDNNSFVLRRLATIGCDEQESVQEFDGKLRWLSRLGVYQYDAANLQRISDPVKDQIASIIATEANNRSIIQTSQSDWQGGNLTAAGPGAPMNAVFFAGAVTPSSFTVTENSTTAWSNGTFSAVVSSYVTTGLASAPQGGVVALVSPTWTFQAGTNLFTNTSSSQVFSLSQSAVNFQDYTGSQSASTETITYGTWAATMSVVSNFTELDWVFASSSATFAAANGYELYYTGNCNVGYACLSLNRLDAGTRTLLSSTTAISPSASGSLNTFNCSFRISRTLDNVFQVTATDVDGGTAGACSSVSLIATDSTYVTNSSYTVIQARAQSYPGPSGLTYQAILKNPSLTRGFPGSATYTSQAFNTGFSTPTGGLLSVNFSSSTDAAVTFQIRDSANGSVFGNTTATTPGNYISNKRQYYDYVTTYTNTTTTKTATISLVTLSAATTGLFLTNCFNPGTSISAWGPLQMNAITSGGSVSVAIATGTSCADATNIKRTFTPQVNNATISVATAPFVAFLTTFTFTQAITQQPQLLDLTINYQTGAARPNVASQVYDNRYWLAYTTSTFTGAFNQNVLVYDSLGRWTKLVNVPAASLWTYRRQLFAGTGDGSGSVIIEDQGLTDQGSSIEMHYRTPDYDLDGDVKLKDLYDLAAEFQPVTDAGTTSSVDVSYFVDRSTIPYSLGPISLNQPESGLLWGNLRFGQGSDPTRVHTVAFKYSNTSQAPITLYRSRLRFWPLDFP